MHVERIAGEGWLALLGGGELTFGETEAADRAWIARTPPGPIGFLPAASGSTDYADHFAAYVDEVFGRRVETVPLYRRRDGLRGKNRERIEACAGLYLGGGVSDQLLEALRDTPAAQGLEAVLARGGTVAAIAAAAQALGAVTRSLTGAELLSGLGWLPGGVVEPNFDPAHDRRLRALLGGRGVGWGLGIPAGSAVLLGPAGEVEVVGLAFALADAEDDLEVLERTH